MISFRTFFRSLRHALHGLFDLFHAEQSFRIQVYAGCLALLFAFLLPLETWQRILILLLVAAVLTLEILNSIIERVADAVQPRLSPMVKEVKDMMAGAVLLTSTAAAIIGIAIFFNPFRDAVCAIIQVCKL